MSDKAAAEAPEVFAFATVARERVEAVREELGRLAAESRQVEAARTDDPDAAGVRAAAGRVAQAVEAALAGVPAVVAAANELAEEGLK